VMAERGLGLQRLWPTKTRDSRRRVPEPARRPGRHSVTGISR
jgi:hypothetical protein